MSLCEDSAQKVLQAPLPSSAVPDTFRGIWTHSVALTDAAISDVLPPLLPRLVTAETNHIATTKLRSRHNFLVAVTKAQDVYLISAFECKAEEFKKR